MARQEARRAGIGQASMDIYGMAIGQQIYGNLYKARPPVNDAINVRKTAPPLAESHPLTWAIVMLIMILWTLNRKGIR